eukprot:1157924-Pelagomonas_calceolata.AAC.12
MPKQLKHTFTPEAKIILLCCPCWRPWPPFAHLLTILTTNLPNLLSSRLNALSPELQAREKEVNSLRERVRAELDAARSLAANAAADRAQVGPAL